MALYDKIRISMIELRNSVDNLYVSEISNIKKLMSLYENKIKEKVVGSLGVRNYSEFDGDIDNIQRGRILRQVKSDISKEIRDRLLVINSNSLKDKLLSEITKLREFVYKDQTKRVAGIYLDIMPSGSKVKIDIKQKDIANLSKTPLAGLSLNDYIQRTLIELYFGIIQSATIGFTDAQTYEGGIKYSLTNIGTKFKVAQKRMVKLSQELVMQASNIAITDINKDLRFKKI